MYIGTWLQIVSLIIFFKNPALQPLLDAAESYDWSNLDPENFRLAVVWFINKCDPKCVLVDQEKPHGRILRYEDSILHKRWRIMTFPNWCLCSAIVRAMEC